jgi:hypothetical protein
MPAASRRARDMFEDVYATKCRRICAGSASRGGSLTTMPRMTMIEAIRGASTS